MNLPRNVKRKIEKLITAIEIPGYQDKKGLYLDFEDDVYMQDRLISIMNDSIYHFALTKSEYEALKADDEIGQMRRDAWSRFSKSEKAKKGDYGELLLYMILDHFYDSKKFATKVRLRSSVKDQIKGYDCAHFTLENGELFLWLGEAKLHEDFSGALDSAFESIKEHVETDYLKDEISILKTNVELENGELKTKVEDILKNPPSMQKLNLKIPVFIGYEWTKLKSLTEQEFRENIEKEIKKKFQNIKTRKEKLKTNFSLIFIILPFRDMKEFKAKIAEIESANRIGE